MRSNKLKLAASAIALATIPSGAMWAEGVHTDAMRLAEAKQFDAALDLLAQADAESKNEKEHRLLKARLLSWSGRYDEAHSVLGALKAEYPKDSAIDASLGYLAYYQSQLDTAERHFKNALAAAPDDGDAAAGIRSVREARAAEERASKRWRIDSGVGVSTFDKKAIEDWGEQYITVSRKQENFTLIGGINRYDRFGAVDTQINAAITHAKRGSIDWGLMASTTPDANFRPKTTFGGHVGKVIKVNETLTAHVAVHYQNNRFESKTVQSVQPEVTTYFKSGLTVKGKAFITSEEGEDTQIGWLAEARVPVTDAASVKIGAADAPELINGSAINTQSLFGGVSFEVADGLTFHVNAARADRENLHVRNDVSIGITRKF